jgi:hypothetical protein
MEKGKSHGASVAIGASSAIGTSLVTGEVITTSLICVGQLGHLAYKRYSADEKIS